MFKKKSDKNINLSRNAIIITILVVVIIILAASVAAIKIDQKRIAKENAFQGYQAVFLTNGKVYFGKVANKTSQFVNLTDIYYLQVNRDLQSPSESGEKAQNISDITLVKLGNELHGPQDEMQINRDQILFIENLKNDGKVVKAIENYKK